MGLFDTDWVISDLSLSNFAKDRSFEVEIGSTSLETSIFCADDLDTGFFYSLTAFFAGESLHSLNVDTSLIKSFWSALTWGLLIS